MDSRLVLGLSLLCACKAELGASDSDGGVNSPDANTRNVDAAIDAPQMLGPWGTPSAVPGASSNLGEDDATLSSNRLELYFKRGDADGANLYMMTRATPTSAWSAPIALTVLNSTVDEESPRLTPDDLTMYFGRNGDIYRTTRGAVGGNWNAPTAVTALNTAAYEKWAAVCANGYVMVSRAVTNNSQDVFEGPDVNTGAPNAVVQFNSTSAEQGLFLTTDCMRVYFQSNRDGQFNIYTATRQSLASAWSNPTSMADFNTATYSEEDPWVAADQRTFVFASNSSGNKDVYIATR